MGKRAEGRAMDEGVRGVRLSVDLKIELIREYGNCEVKEIYRRSSNSKSEFDGGIHIIY